MLKGGAQATVVRWTSCACHLTCCHLTDHPDSGQAHLAVCTVHESGTFSVYIQCLNLVCAALTRCTSQAIEQRHVQCLLFGLVCVEAHVYSSGRLWVDSLQVCSSHQRLYWVLLCAFPAHIACYLLSVPTDVQPRKG
jgi:hypothetical protein